MAESSLLVASMTFTWSGLDGTSTLFAEAYRINRSKFGASQRQHRIVSDLSVWVLAWHEIRWIGKLGAFLFFLPMLLGISGANLVNAFNKVTIRKSY